MCKILIKILKRHAIRNSSLQNSKVLFIKKMQKNYSKMNYEQLQNFEFLAEDSTSDYWCLLRQVNNFTVETEEC